MTSSFQTGHHRLCHPPSRPSGSAHLHSASGREKPDLHPEGQPSEDSGGQGSGHWIPGEGDEGLLRRRLDRDLPARGQARHQRKHRGRNQERAREAGRGELTSEAEVHILSLLTVSGAQLIVLREVYSVEPFYCLPYPNQCYPFGAMFS